MQFFHLLQFTLSSPFILYEASVPGLLHSLNICCTYSFRTFNTVSFLHLFYLNPFHLLHSSFLGLHSTLLHPVYLSPPSTRRSLHPTPTFPTLHQPGSSVSLRHELSATQSHYPACYPSPQQLTMPSHPILITPWHTLAYRDALSPSLSISTSLGPSLTSPPFTSSHCPPIPLSASSMTASV